MASTREPSRATPSGDRVRFGRDRDMLAVIPSRGDGEGPRSRSSKSQNPNPRQSLKYPNSNGWHQLLWELKPWDFLGIWCLGFGISIASPSASTRFGMAMIARKSAILL